jgi:hypothetical protein
MAQCIRAARECKKKGRACGGGRRRVGLKVGDVNWWSGLECRRHPKSDLRNPKENRNPKSECRTRSLPTQLRIRPQKNCLKTFQPIAVQFPPSFVVNFGLRSSAFGFLSDFGSRISDFISDLGFRAFGIPQQSTPRAAQFMMTIE